MTYMHFHLEYSIAIFSNAVPAQPCAPSASLPTSPVVRSSSWTHNVTCFFSPPLRKNNSIFEKILDPMNSLQIRLHYLQCAASVSLAAEGAVLDLISADHSEVIREDTIQAAPHILSR